jgi:hypothetical protein
MNSCSVMVPLVMPTKSASTEPPTGRRYTDNRMSYRDIAAEVAKQGHASRSGKP